MKWIICLFLGHFYRPVYDYTYRQAAHSPNGRKRNERFRYQCDCCGKETKWLTRTQHEKFVSKCNPTWGGRGSDSQGNREGASHDRQDTGRS